MLDMKKGELAFFYHSNTKVPGIVGIAEIVGEATPDETAFDENSPYYDAKSSRDKPKWMSVHVVFRQKFAHPEEVSLPKLRANFQEGAELKDMQLFKQSRLSVSKISKAEW